MWNLLVRKTNSVWESFNIFSLNFQFLERLQYFEDESYRHKIELIEKTRREIQDDIEKKLAGQHKLSRRDQEMYEALNGK